MPSRLISTSVDADKVGPLMRQSRAGRAVLMLDCCHGGAFERGFNARADGSVAIESSFDQKSVGGGRGRVIITASNAVQYAFDGTDLADGREIQPPSSPTPSSKGSGTALPTGTPTVGFRMRAL